MKDKFYLGIIFILIGISVAFKQLGLWDLSNLIWTWWPLLLVGAGTRQLIRKPISKTSGITLLALGILFQMRELNIINVSLMSFFWPAIIIAIGVSLLLPKSLKKEDYEFSKKEVDQDVVDDLSVFSGVNSRNNSNNFRGGSLVSIFGGINMDLSNANLLNDAARIDVTAVFGGVNVIVPKNWTVVVRGIPIFGGWSNKTNSKNYDNPDAPVLTLNCFVAFGGVEIKN
ncbi:cell wall-active antibiotics response protein [Clostridium algoriphilum]|uniref:LiaF transmembrane domain-containing protein n=1 Tax=Clostridium algoriphilum TaxID=198347 RepID=UPI001CF5AE9B|nr:DUF5668 domain-containing protein [Clostridium algoriphilum]MCB2294942.1 cell wall-active antibiotics response protein [Clostridium algoriphilum]